jgi:hypothetical protein
LDFYEDILEDGYHIFSLTKAQLPGFYLNQFPDYSGAKINQLRVGDDITIRAFFPISKGDPIQLDGGYIDLEIEHIESDHVLAVIRTQLPAEFALETGDTLEIREDEILYKIESKDH